MTLASHAVVGSILAAATRDPYIVIGGGIVLHYASDYLPHWDFGTHLRKKSRNRLIVESFFDVGMGWLLAIPLFYYLGGDSFWWLFVGVISSQLPDWLATPYLFLKWRFPPFTWYEAFTDVFHNKLDKPWGIVTQIGFVIAVYILIYHIL